MSNYITDRQYTDYIHKNVAIPTVYAELGWKELPVDSEALKGLDIDYGTDYIFTKDGLLMTVQERFREVKYKNYTDFTIRYRRDGNYHKERKESEFFKIKANYFTYGITNCLKTELAICSQFVKVAIINLNVVFDKIDKGEIIIQDNGKRLCTIEDGKLICPVIKNHDHSSSFVPFDIPSLVEMFGDEVLVYSKGFDFEKVADQKVETPEEVVIRPILDSVPEEEQYVTYLPLYSIRAAAGYFGEGELVEKEGWMKAEGIGRLNRNMFVVRIVGHSMEPRINDGDFCVFQANPAGSRQGMIVLAQHRGYFDEDNAGSYSVKEYHSTKKYDEYGNWAHETIELRPYNPDYNPIVLTPDDIDDFRIVGGFVGILQPEELEEPEPISEPVAQQKHYGYCIRCGKEIDYSYGSDQPKYYCKDCWRDWYRSGHDTSLKEHYCHRCGKSHPASVDKPLCWPDCWKAIK